MSTKDLRLYVVVVLINYPQTWKVRKKETQTRSCHAQYSYWNSHEYDYYTIYEHMNYDYYLLYLVTLFMVLSV